MTGSAMVGSSKSPLESMCSSCTAPDSATASGSLPEPPLEVVAQQTAKTRECTREQRWQMQAMRGLGEREQPGDGLLPLDQRHRKKVLLSRHARSWLRREAQVAAAATAFPGRRSDIRRWGPLARPRFSRALWKRPTASRPS